MDFDVMHEHGKAINTFLVKAGFPVEEAEARQILNLIEEIGEAVAAGRRYLGMAQRIGTMEELASELADVVITTFVTAEVFRVSVTPVPNAGDLHPVDIKAAQQMQLITLGVILGSYLDEVSIASTLDSVVAQTEVIASLFKIDLEEAIAKKLAIVYSRGWKDERFDLPII